jgi:fatty acid desaturase
MQQINPITDPTYQPREYKGLDKFFIQFLHDKRDLPFIYLTLKITFIMLPVAVLLYMPFVPTWLWWVLSVFYFYLNTFVYKGPFGLMLHCTSHRTWFKKKYGIFNHYLPWVVGLFFGQTPRTYYSHHIWMHHPENNLMDDESTTMKYRRNTFKEFMKYFLDFLFIGMIRLTGYFSRKNKTRLIINCITGETLFILLCVGLSFINFPATFMVFILSFFVSRFVMMLGNWTQHAFVDEHEPENAYKNSVTCINVKYNHKCWNDGYHISHHVRPGMHWTQHPLFFQEHLDEFVKNKAIIFQGIGFLEIFWFLMWQRYDKLAYYGVNINGNTFKSDEEFIQLLKERTHWKLKRNADAPIHYAFKEA